MLVIAVLSVLLLRRLHLHNAALCIDASSFEMTAAALMLLIMTQVVHIEAVKEGIFSSFVQMRGSIPTYWTQVTFLLLQATVVQPLVTVRTI
jgi:SacI homology domain